MRLKRSLRHLSKIKSYIGLCRKAGQLTVGYNNLEQLKKGAKLIIMDEKMGESTQKKVIKISQNLSAPLLICKDLSLYCDAECLVCCLRNANLAKAVLQNLDENFSLFQGGQNG